MLKLGSRLYVTRKALGHWIDLYTGAEKPPELFAGIEPACRRTPTAVRLCKCRSKACKPNRCTLAISMRRRTYIDMENGTLRK